ncbi:MAG: DNA primase, partial [Acidimicrobiales bacterium]|nr:DNA primase [Acidimicrobiales bacterium]
MAIPDEDVAAVRAQTDIVALIGEHLSLRRQGRRFVGLCPFHTEKTPSFSVNPEQGLYYCFGCQASGDAISFLRVVEHLDFVEAVERLAARAGVTLHQQPGGGRVASSQRERLLAAMEAAVAFYHERLLHHRDAGPARVYLRSRGYDERTVRMFRLGWAPDEWDALVRALPFPADIVRDAGLSFVNRTGRRQDVFRARVIFPIFDPGGRAVALGGRVLPEGSAGAPPAAASGSPSDGSAQVPKYRNSAETPVYSKRRTLYGLNWAKADVIEKGEVVVCEGYTDVIAFHQAGVPRAVATCGTALAEDHVRVLRNFARRVVLAYDADAAGQAAAERFYEWERRFELDIAVADLPSGTDPADLGARDPAALRAAVETARPYLDFQVERVLASADLRTAEGRAKAAEAALEAVAEHPRALVRDQYVMSIADRCRFDSSTLRPLLERKRREARAR